MLGISESISHCEATLARMLGRNHCVLTGTGTSALWIAYSLLEHSRHKILLPAMTCLTPMLAVHYALRTPVFADVRERDATIDPSVVESMLARDSEIGAVLAVHLYGNPADMEALREVTARYGVTLIEDLAQALGGRYGDGSYFGAVGDCAVVSFGHTKILDVGGGGALLTDNVAWATQARAMAKQLGEQPADLDRLSLMYRKLFYSIWESGQVDRACYQMFDLFPTLFRTLHVYRITGTTASKILTALNGLESEVAHRKRIAALYEEALRKLNEVQTFETSDYAVPWRFSFRLAKGIRSAVLTKVRSAGYDVSSWYPSITEWTPSGRMQGRKNFPMANRLEQEVVNFWVSRDYTEEKALSLTKVLKEILAKF